MASAQSNARFSNQTNQHVAVLFELKGSPEICLVQVTDVFGDHASSPHGHHAGVSYDPNTQTKRPISFEY